MGRRAAGVLWTAVNFAGTGTSDAVPANQQMSDPEAAAAVADLVNLAAP